MHACRGIELLKEIWRLLHKEFTVGCAKLLYEIHATVYLRRKAQLIVKQNIIKYQDQVINQNVNIKDYT